MLMTGTASAALAASDPKGEPQHGAATAQHGSQQGAQQDAAPAPAHGPAPAAAPVGDKPTIGGAVAKPSPFAAQLAEMPRAAPGAHPEIDIPTAWSLIARSSAETRQAARWKLVTALLAGGRGAEALGVLETMQRDDQSLELVPAWRLAMGTAQAMAGRGTAAIAWFNAPELAADPEACAWRIRAGAVIDGPEGGVLLRCAIPAILARRGAERAAFLIAAATALNRSGHADRALHFLNPLPDQMSAANLQRGIALLATGDGEGGKLKLDRVMLSGTAQERAEAELVLIRDGLKRGAIKPANAVKQLDALTFRWRGGPVERAALELKWTLAEEGGDPVRALIASATLFRHFDLGAQTSATLQRIQAGLSDLVNDSRRPVAQAAGLFWEYRDMAPTGAPGDLLVSTLADRLSGAGLYVRAAELLQHQMLNRAVDIAKGPVSVRIARLLLMADKPDQVLVTMRMSDGPNYPAPIAQDRHRMQVIATWRLGRREDALAMLDQIDQAADLRAEMLWQGRDWKRFAGANAALLAPARSNAILRQAVALAMIGDDAGLAALNRRFAPALRGTKAGAALAALASPRGAVDAAALDAAMAGLAQTPVEGDLLLLAQG